MNQVILNKGSIHSHSAGEDLNQNRDLPLVLREDFAKICFETLLQYSLLDQSDPLLTNGNIEHVTNGVAHLAMDKDAKITNKLAVTSLLHRFKEVVTSYIADEELHGSVPLPSHRVSEMSFVLKALATLISSLKRSSAGVDKRTWGLVIGLYPDLVRATVTNAEAVASSLQQVKLLFVGPIGCRPYYCFFLLQVLLLLLLLLQSLSRRINIINIFMI